MSTCDEQALIFHCDGDEMVGIAHLPRAAKSIGVVFVVGGPQYRVGSHRQFTLMARALAQAGYPVLRFDYRGMGDSAGKARAFDAVDDDIAAALDALQRLQPQLRKFALFGLCDAASACMIYATRKDARTIGLMVANPWVRSVAGEATAFLKHYYLKRFLQPTFWRNVVTGKFNVLGSIRGLIATVARARKGADAGRSEVQATIATSATATGNFVDRMLRGVQSNTMPTLLLTSQNDLTAQEFIDLSSSHDGWRRWKAHALVNHCTLNTDHTFSTPDGLQAAIASSIDWLHRQAAA
jgi:exosortase A-associated hydrolase 1